MSEIAEHVDRMLTMLGPKGRPRFHPGHGPVVKAEGVAMQKASPTWVVQIHVPFEVETNEGMLTASAGDYLAYDEKSGHVWPVAAGYVQQNYQPVEEAAETTSSEMPKVGGLPATHALYAAFEALEAAARHLSAQDVATAEALCATEVIYRPLTVLCGEAAAGLRDHIAERIGLVTGEHVGLGHDTPVTTLRSVSEPSG